MHGTSRWPLAHSLADLCAGVALCLLLPACSGGTTAAQDSAMPDGLSADLDAGARRDADGPVPDTGPPTVAPLAAPTDVKTGTWMVGWIPNTLSADPVATALEKGQFNYPAAGTDAGGIHWSARTQDDKGQVGSFPYGISYAVAKVTLSSPAHLLVLSQPTGKVWVNGAPRPGDVYASGTVRVALPAKAGENLVVVQVYVRSNSATLTARLQTTPDELYMNFADAVLPDPLVGDMAELCIGVPVLNLAGVAAHDLKARVLGDASFEATTVTVSSLGPHSTTQVAFRLKPKQAAAAAAQELAVKLQLESPALKFAYQREVKLTTVGADTAYRRSRISGVDGSCQYYGVMPPTKLDKTKKYALILSLHGAGVEALGQAKSYSQKDWAFVVAPTNRRRFGFDWEVWGRLDAIEALDHAMQTYSIDPTRVYLTGHSMGGHGTWHVGVMNTGRFGAIAPSAGWCSFYTYGGATKPTGAFARTQAHSDTPSYLSNLKSRGAYILHGGADTNVPTTEGQNMYKLMQAVTTDVKYHEEAGAGHWWDGTKAAGADCVDWPDLMTFLQAHTLDPTELEFDWKTPAPWVNATHSFVALQSQTTPMSDSRVVSQKTGTSLALTTTNVRGMKLDGAALKKAGITALSVDGKNVALADGPITVGATDGKKPGVYGPFNEVMYRPFCFVYSDTGADAYREYAAYLASTWAVIGNGQACAMPLSRFKASPPASMNLIFVGLEKSEIDSASPPVTWDSTSVTVGTGSALSDVMALFVFPRKDRLAAAVVATKNSEYLLFRIQPFTSRNVFPDYFVYSATGSKAAGFFDATWKYDSSL